jgi:SpoVK/Ycf46/Vps4 family AAA+-type ATPase
VAPGERAPVFVAATANEVESLPPELVRRGRFDEIFFVDLPAAKERAEILAIHLSRRGRDPRAFPVEELTRGLEHFSGAELEQGVIAALFRAFSAAREVTPEDLRSALTEVVPLAPCTRRRCRPCAAGPSTARAPRVGGPADAGAVPGLTRAPAGVARR